MKQILLVLSAVAVIVSLQAIGGDQKADCSQCPNAKTAVGKEAKSECSKADAGKTAVGKEAKSECSKADAGKTAVGKEAKSECSKADAGKTAVGKEAKSECSKQKTLTFKVGGAVCEKSCGNLVKALTRLDGVSQAESCTKSQMTKVSFDPAKVKSCAISAAIKEAGYKVEGQQVSLPVEGMACGSCSTKVGKVLTSLEGVISGSACHQSKKATILFNPEKLNQEKIVAAINGTGFKVVLQ